MKRPGAGHRGVKRFTRRVDYLLASGPIIMII